MAKVQATLPPHIHVDLVTVPVALGGPADTFFHSDLVLPHVTQFLATVNQ